MWLSSRQKRGFTLIETIVTLSIAVMLVALPSLQATEIHQDITKRQFVNNFVTEFNHSIKKSLINNKSIYIRKLGKEIIFSCSDEVVTLKIPVNFSIYGLENSLAINKDKVSSPRTITFKSGKWTKKIKIQMVWGQIIES